MTCHEAQELIHAYMDGELDLVTNLAMERHLRECPTCPASLREQQSIQSLLRRPGLYSQPPASLGKAVERSLERRGRVRSAAPWWTNRWLVAAAALIGLAIIATGVVRLLPRSRVSEPLVAEVVAGHIRSLMANHLADVASTDQHTVKPWFAGKLDFSPPVRDLSGEGYPLVGGRLDYLDNRPVAALVYQRRQHSINLFVWPAGDERATKPETITRQGYNLIFWKQSGMNWWAVSDLNAAELREFVSLVSR
jgi:anti-sigma factor RsiW